MIDFSTLCMGIPTINQAELLNEALKTYVKTFFGRHIYIVDNGNQEIPQLPMGGLKIMKQKKNLGVAASWNLMCRCAIRMGYTHILILNDDVVTEKYADSLEDYIDDVGADLFIGDNNFSMFILSLDAYQKMGPFDENFKGAYFEDNDYLWRAKQNQLIVEHTELMNPEVYHQSMSIRKDPELNSNFESNKQYYISKWGGVPTEEKFITPFNQ